MGDYIYGGISIKLASNQSIPLGTDKLKAFHESTITQFEYTYYPNKPPGLWYDILNVDGYVAGDTEGWDGTRPWPFQEMGLIVEGTSPLCPTIVCPKGNPNGNATCVDAYTHSKDDWATKSCINNNSIVLTLCTIVGALRNILPGSDVNLSNNHLYEVPTPFVGSGCRID